MKKTILFLVLLISGIALSQSLNTYKYVLVESKFKFQNSPNQFNLNTLTKLYFQKMVVLGNDYFRRIVKYFWFYKRYASR